MNDFDITLRAEHTVSQRTVGLSGQRPLRLQRVRLNGHNVPPHDHAFYEIFIVLDGGCRHETATGQTRFTSGSVAVLAPGRIHAIGRSRVQAINLYYLAEWLLDDLPTLWAEAGLVALFLEQALFRRPPGQQVPQFALEPKALEACTRDLNDLEAESQRPKPSLPFLKAALMKCLCRLTRAAVAAHQVQPHGFRPEVWAYLNAVENAVQRGDAVAAGVPRTRSSIGNEHLARLVREATGMSPTAYFQQRRIQNATLRLLDPSRTITEVALGSGFADAAHFSRGFRRHHGMSPSAFRRVYASSSPSQ
ncbi:MAG: helix-turn-helix domain-containing protein [Opitutales bacterium]